MSLSNTTENAALKCFLQGTDTNGEKVTICEGEYVVTQDITKT